MSYDESDARYDAMMDSLYEQFYEDPGTREQFYEELYDEIVKDFADARLRSSYEAEPLVAGPSATALDEARKLRGQHDTSAFLFGAIATEVGLRATLLKPIVYGLVHAESAAGLIAKLLVERSDERLTKVLLDLLAAHGGVDVRAHRRARSARSVWEETTQVREKRNRVVHQAETASPEDADLAIAVASCVLEELFPAVVARLGLHLHGSRVCGIPPTAVIGGHPIP